MNVDEFLPPEDSVPSEPAELDVQKAVVESLAADKAEQAEQLREVRMQLAIRDGQVKSQEAMMKSLHEKINALTATVEELRAKEYDQQERNPNALALLDRDVELPDRFPGESRDHVLEALAEARARAEADGRIRHAQVLEGVLVANEPNGTLAQRRAELQKLFDSNGNIISGPVLAELERMGIPHKNGESYLLPAEIIKRTY